MIANPCFFILLTLQMVSHRFFIFFQWIADARIFFLFLLAAYFSRMNTVPDTRQLFWRHISQEGTQLRTLASRPAKISEAEKCVQS